MNGKTLTAEQCSKLSLYILMTTKTREGEAEAWEKLANERRFFQYLRGVRARCYGAVGERHYLISVLCSRQMQGARRRCETL